MKELFKKLLLCLLPFLLGILDIIYEKARLLNLNFLGLSFAETISSFLIFILLILLYYLFFNSLKSNYEKFDINWFDFKIPSISPYIYLSICVAIIFILPFTTWKISAFLRTVFLGVIIEELLARGIFIKYPEINNKEFLLLAIIVNSSFSLNHWFYGHNYIKLSLFEQITKFFNHFSYGLVLTGLTFKSKKLEPSVILHSLSNINVYIGRVNANISTFLGIFLYILQILSLIGLGYKKK